MFDIIQLQKVKSLLVQPKNIVLVSHKNPDGDTIGAALGMFHYLKLKGHTVSAVVPNDFPSFYKWLPGSEEMIIFEKEVSKSRNLIQKADIIFCMDFNSLSRTGTLADDLAKASGIKIMIDHHPEPSDEFMYSFSVVESSSTGEIVFAWIEKLGDVDKISKNAALALYTAIMTDTGSFSYSCNRKETYDIVGKLIDMGVDASLVHRLVYDTFTENRLRLLGFAISERMLVWNDLHTAVIYLTKADLKKYKYQVGDTEGVVNYPLSMENTNLAVLITEKDQLIRMSFRSKGNFDVNKLARKDFNGGGHKNAAGGNSPDSMEKTIDRLRKVLKGYKNDLNYKITL